VDRVVAVAAPVVLVAAAVAVAAAVVVAARAVAGVRGLDAAAAAVRADLQAVVPDAVPEAG